MAAGAAAVAAAGFFPISELSTYNAARWLIRARVTSKGQLRSFNSRGGTAMQVFDVVLMDESGEIRASFFGQLADKYHGVLEPGRVYTFSRGVCRIANRQYNRCPHRYELVFDRDGLVEPAADDGRIETVRFNFVDLRALQSRSLPCSVDICAVVVNVGPPVAFTSQGGKELVKRELIVADDTATSLAVAIWGERAKEEDPRLQGNPVVCLKGVGVKEFKGGRSGSLEQTGAIVFDARQPDVQRVQQWWASTGSKANLTSLSLSNEGVSDLHTLQTRALPCTVDLCGVVVGAKPPFSFTSQAGKELVKREIVLADNSGLSIQVALWGERAQQEDTVFEGNPLLLLRGVIVKEWNGGRSASLSEGGSLLFAPSTPEAEKVQLWWSTGGASQALTSLSMEGGAMSAARLSTGRISSMSELRRALELVSAGPEVHAVVARLSLVQTKKQGETQPLVYMACQEPRSGSSLPCNKRVGEDGLCPLCGRMGRAAPRLNLRCRFSDYGDNAWLTTFHEAAQSVLAMTAVQARDMELADGGREALEARIRRRYFMQPLQVTVKARLDSYQGEPRTNAACVDARPVHRGQHGRLLLKGIHDMLAKRAERAA